MKRIFLIVILSLMLALFICLRYGFRQREERTRLELNQRTLMEESRRYRVRDSLNAATVRVLTLRGDEFRRHFGELNALVRDMNVKLQRVESLSQNSLESRYDISAPVRDTVITRSQPMLSALNLATQLSAASSPAVSVSSVPLQLLAGSASSQLSTLSVAESPTQPTRLSAQAIGYRDAYISLNGVIVDSVFRGTVITYDTLTQIVHRVPRRFWFIRWGTRELRQEIVSSNPHTRITYSRSIRLAH